MGIRATLDLAGLAPDDVRVEVIIGRIGSNGYLEDTEVILAPLMEQDGMFTVFATEVTPAQTGRLGYALRISPNHCDDPLTRPCTALMKWAQ
jgi:starch phosphorylase